MLVGRNEIEKQGTQKISARLSIDGIGNYKERPFFPGTLFNLLCKEDDGATTPFADISLDDDDDDDNNFGLFVGPNKHPSWSEESLCS